MNPTISVCMIVKNEQDMLPRCLRSIVDWVDQIIIVDTGSSDNSVEIAKSFGALVYHHKWEADFSKHQNQSIDYASSDWILQLDADEELEEGSGPIIRKIIKNTGVDAYFVNIISYFNNRTSYSRESKIRIFRNKPWIRFKNVVHKQLYGFKKAAHSKVTIKHYGYDLTPEKMAQKFQRTSSLLRKQIKDEPNNYWHRHNLAVCLASNFRFQEAIEQGLKALDLAKKQKLSNPNVAWTYYIVSASYLKLSQYSKAKEMALEALNLWPNHLDSHFVLVILYHKQRLWQKLGYHIKEFFRISQDIKISPELFAGAVLNTPGEIWRVWIAYGDLLLASQDDTAAHKAFESAISLAPSQSECRQLIARCYQKRSMWEEAISIYEQDTCQKSSPSVLAGLALCYKKLGNKERALFFYKKLLEVDPLSIEGMVNLGDILYEQGRFDEALKYFDRVLDQKPVMVQCALKASRICAQYQKLNRVSSYAELITKALSMNLNVQQTKPETLANIYLIIGHEFDKLGREDLFKSAIETALILHPNLLS